MLAKTGMMKLNYIFLTHLHADHILGIPGLLETMAFQGRKNPLTIAGPFRTVDLLEKFSSIGCCSKDFEIKAIELCPGDIVERDGYKVEAIQTNHSIPSLGYVLSEDKRPGRFNREAAISLGIPPGPLFGKLQRGQSVDVDGRTISPDQVMGPQRPGRRIVYTGDTRPCQSVEDASSGADLLIHDGALANDMINWAIETKHSTVAEAAMLAKRAGVLQLVLTHVSSRYSDDISPLIEEARLIFENSIVAWDLMSLEIMLRDS
jgi:ribonuclease Z